MAAYLRSRSGETIIKVERLVTFVDGEGHAYLAMTFGPENVRLLGRGERTVANVITTDQLRRLIADYFSGKEKPTKQRITLPPTLPYLRGTVFPLEEGYRLDYVNRAAAVSANKPFTELKIQQSETLKNLWIAPFEQLPAGCKGEFMLRFFAQPWAKDVTECHCVSSPEGGYQVALAWAIQSINKTRAQQMTCYLHVIGDIVGYSLFCKEKLGAIVDSVRGTNRGVLLIQQLIARACQSPKTVFVANKSIISDAFEESAIAQMADEILAPERAGGVPQTAEVWVPVGAGHVLLGLMLSNGLKSRAFVGVDLNGPKSCLPNILGVDIVRSKYEYEEPAAMAADKESAMMSRFYDAKAWEKAVEYARLNKDKQVLFWSIM